MPSSPAPASCRALLALVVSLVGGCSAFVPWEQTVTVRTLPEGVPVRIDGQDHGPSPVTLKLRRDESHTVVATTQGAYYARELHSKVSATGALDLAAGAILIVPGLGLLAPGAWDLDGTDLTLDLRDLSATTRPAEPPLRRPADKSPADKSPADKAPAGKSPTDKAPAGQRPGVAGAIVTWSPRPLPE
jgi:hypothetical protein